MSKARLSNYFKSEKLFFNLKKNPMDEHIKILYKCIQNRYVKVTWSHKIQEIQGDLYYKKSEKIKRIRCVLSVLTTGGALFSILPFVDLLTIQGFANDFNIKTSVTALLASILSYYTLRYGDGILNERSNSNKQFAAKLHNLRNKYESLMTDIVSGLLSEEQIVNKRDELSEAENDLYMHAPLTTSNAVKKASVALKIKKESTTESEEIDEIVPSDLIIH